MSKFFMNVSKRIKLAPGRFSSWTRIPRNIKGFSHRRLSAKVPAVGFRRKESF